MEAKKKIKKTLLPNKKIVLNLRLLNQIRSGSEILTHSVTVALRFLVPSVKVRILVGQLQILKTLQVIGEFFCFWTFLWIIWNRFKFQNTFD